MLVVNTHEAKTRLSELLRLVEERHERIRICRNGRPVAEIAPIPKPDRSPLEQSSRLRGIIYKESPLQPLSDDDWSDAQRP
jgi:prevent-host-death family protein